MNRVEALQIGKIIADRWYKYQKPIILAQQNIKKATTPASK